MKGCKDISFGLNIADEVHDECIPLDMYVGFDNVVFIKSKLRYKKIHK